MERNVMKKIVYEDEGITKVLKGLILKEDDFTYEVEAINSKEIITIGKRAIVKITSLQDGGK